MHRIMIYLCMIDQMIAEAETKGRAVPQQRQESSGNACMHPQGKEYCYL